MNYRQTTQLRNGASGRLEQLRAAADVRIFQPGAIFHDCHAFLLGAFVTSPWPDEIRGLRALLTVPTGTTFPLVLRTWLLLHTASIWQATSKRMKMANLHKGVTKGTTATIIKVCGRRVTSNRMCTWIAHKQNYLPKSDWQLTRTVVLRSQELFHSKSLKLRYLCRQWWMWLIRYCFDHPLNIGTNTDHGPRRERRQ